MKEEKLVQIPPAVLDLGSKLLDKNTHPNQGGHYEFRLTEIINFCESVLKQYRTKK
jgi:hypothetical protein